MPGSEEIQWVKSTANELNNLLQVISESSQVLETICTESPDTESELPSFAAESSEPPK